MVFLDFIAHQVGFWKPSLCFPDAGIAAEVYSFFSSRTGLPVRETQKTQAPLLGGRDPLRGGNGNPPRILAWKFQAIVRRPESHTGLSG